MNKRFALMVILLLTVAGTSLAQTTAFTYQGKLVDNGNLANTAYDMQFKLFDAVSAGTQIGVTLTYDGTGTNPPAVSVTNGIFAVTLDFGTCSPASPCFNGNPRFLEITIKPHGSGSYVTLTPRQPVTATPYAMKTTNLTFNAPFDDGAGTNITASNTFGGDSAGLNTTPSPTLNNSQGKLNAFFGAGAGQQNTFGSVNAFFGTQAGQHNNTGCCNAFFGYQAGQLSTATDNAYFGFQAGKNNILGTENAFFGNAAGFSATGGTANTFIGTLADFNTSNSGGNFNTLLGFAATVISGVNNGTAIGFRAHVTQSNSLVLGGINGINGANADTNVGIGTTAPTERLQVVGNGLFTGNLTASGAFVATQYNIVSPALGSSIRLLGISGTGDTNTFLGRNAAAANPTGSFNSFFGNGAGQSTVAGGNNSFFGSGAGSVNVSGTDNAFFGRNAGNANTANDNSFFGSLAGSANTSGTANSYFGKEAGRNNSIGSYNTIFGYQAGYNTNSGGNAFFGALAGTSNISGTANSFFGTQAGDLNTDGSSNSFFGGLAGHANTTGNNNTFLGIRAGFTHANTTGNNNTFLGIRAGFTNATGNNNTFIGIDAKFNVLNPTGANNTLLGANASIDTGVSNGTAIGANSGVTQSNSLVLGNNANIGIGTTAPATKLHVSGTGIIRARVDSNDNAGLSLTLSNQPKWSVATVTGGQFQIFNDALGSNAFWITSTNNFVGIGTTSPDQLLSVNGNASKAVGGGSWATFSDERLKNIHDNYTRGLNALMQLKPIRFEYKPDNALGLRSTGESIGFSAQEVRRILPEAVSLSTNGYLQINNDPILWTMLNAVKEQQAQIATQQTEIESQRRFIERQQQQLEALKSLVCSAHRKANACK